MEELKRKNKKGLYCGEIKNVVGLDIRIDEPNAHLMLNNCGGMLEINLKELVEKFNDKANS